ncbi:hypothetical protein DFAR_1540056 [Desulfarculales bacterium]
MDFLRHQAPVVVMRTFSTSAGLAGLRIGYALGPAEVIAAFDRVRQPFNTSSLAQAGALAALGDDEFWQRTKALIVRGLKEFYACFDRLGIFYVPTQTNFVLLKIGPKASAVADKLLGRGVIVREMTSYGLPDFLRISVGLDEENARFCQEFSDVLSGEAG